MIDTDKYEGHTEGPWKPYESKYSRMWTIGNLSVKWKEADKNLVADAPLLLQEVKRLREENDMLSEAVKEDNDILKKHIETLEEVKRLREELDGREAYIKRLSEQLSRATKWAYKQVLHNDSAMMDFDDYVWGEEK